MINFVKNKSLIFLLILSCFWIIIRLFGVTNPLIDAQFWRQTDTASIARNFYEEDFNILHPRVNWRGDTEGFVESEFPIYSFLIASFYKISGKVNDSAGRILSLLFSLGTAITLYLFVLRIFDRRTAVLSYLFFMLSPLSIYYSITFMPDSMMIFFYLQSLYLFYRWVYDNKSIFWISSCGSLAISLLIKPTAIFVFIPMLAILWEKEGKKFISGKRPVILYLVLASAPSILWYLHAYKLFMITDLSFGILAGQTYNKFASVSILLSSKFWQVILNNIFSIHLTPVGATLFFIALSLGIFEENLIKANRFLYYWVGSVFLFILVVAEGNMTLEYYQLFLIPVASIFCARFVIYLLDELSLNYKAQISLIITIFFFIGLGSFFIVKKRLKPVKYTSNSYNFARKIEHVTHNKDKFIVIDSPSFYPKEWYDKMKFRIRRPSLLYFLNRKGWVFLPHEMNAMSASDFYSIIKKGARYFVLPKEIEETYSGIAQFIRKNRYQIIDEDSFFTLYKLYCSIDDQNE